MEKLFTVNEAAKIVDARVPQMYCWISEGIIPSVRIGRKIRVSPEALQKFIAEGGRGYAGSWKKEI